MAETPNFTIDDSVIRDIETARIIETAFKKKASFGIELLDDALIGMLPNDLVLVGARSGQGKTQLAVDIAKNNSMIGKNVVFIALEAEPNEIEMRLRYQIEASLFFHDANRPYSVTMNYRTWRFGIHKDQLAIYHAEATRIFTERYATLRTVYREKQFGFHDLEKVLVAVHKDADLIIVDHLHYFDLESGASHNEQTSKLVKHIRTLNLFYNIPIVLVAHVRKNDSIIPELDDFMGSSDIAKVATVAVMMAKNPGSYDSKNQLFGTYVSIPKSRTGGLGVVGLLQYSMQHNSYMTGYKLGRVNSHGDKIEEIEKDQWPQWATNKGSFKKDF